VRLGWIVSCCFEVIFGIPSDRLSTLPADIGFDKLVDMTKLRWRIERDYRELKQELGLGHYEGRGWRGFHHHATLCIAAYGFLVSERETIPPSRPPRPPWFEKPTLPQVIDPEAPPIRPEPTSQAPSPACVGVLPWRSPGVCRAVRAAPRAMRSSVS
jgi:hypothetical protein